MAETIQIGVVDDPAALRMMLQQNIVSLIRKDDELDNFLDLYAERGLYVPSQGTYLPLQERAGNLIDEAMELLKVHLRESILRCRQVVNHCCDTLGIDRDYPEVGVGE